MRASCRGIGVTEICLGIEIWVQGIELFVDVEFSVDIECLLRGDRVEVKE